MVKVGAALDLLRFRQRRNICIRPRAACPIQSESLRSIRLALLMAGLAHAAIITVPCSGSGRGASGLIAAIETANGTTGANTIYLTPGCVYAFLRCIRRKRERLTADHRHHHHQCYGATIERSEAVGTPNLRIFAVASVLLASPGNLTLNAVSSNAAKSSITI